MNALTPLPVLLPLVAAGVTLVLGRFPRAQAAVSMTTLSAVLGISLALLAGTHFSGPHATAVGGWTAPFGIVLMVDRLSALMLVVSTIVTLSVLIYAVGQGNDSGDNDTPVSIFHPTYLIMTAGVSDAFIAGDLFNMYVGFEILLSASYVLLTLGGTESRVRAGVTYVVVSLVSSMIFLIAIGFVYGATGTVNIAQLALRLGALPTDVQMLLHVGLLVAFAIKAAVFPLSFWLPDSYPTAPAPVTAVFAGLLTKVGIYAIIRTETVMFPGATLSVPLMWLAGLTMLVGILGAIAQTDIKRLLSFTLVSHIGYMLFGVALGTRAGLAAAIYYVVHHITVQTTLFLVAGLIERRGGSTSLRRLGGLAKVSPILGVLFFIPAMNLAGIPPFSGFLGKLGLFRAGVADGSWLAYALIGAGVATSLLTLYAIGRVWNYAFWRDPVDAEEPDTRLVEDYRAASGAASSAGRHGDAAVDTDAGRRVETTVDTETRAVPHVMTGVTAAMVGVSVLLTVCAGPLYSISEAAATGVHAQSYVHTVLGGDGQ
ncbi:Na+/H+ antiporter subunit D [Spelaeicoccus albus]|uniref:Multicomponent Na+:H+ antiporter subunit D n=1 Tax=Spelaeicoccus albus TaxID=1280376 RepID=A0A7Z0D149_9MICO|nr:Na+/H+ antiporter subunit D [Spelaeicoccus albus]NYI66338.1 multicomponent Na+:H+ antiporter subunit D [Spelaeicoccus albus]